ncbi:MAG: sulfatase-like hydrolase/transferase [Bacteroidaceae bacterium]|nr:sulfatase-like hydrolase/transferase [Bacteroidaceae bacterium]
MKLPNILKENKPKNLILALALNITIAYALLFICRMIFIAMNIDMFTGVSEHNSMWLMAKGALLFDTSAVCYLNTLYLLCLLFPLHIKEGKAMQAITKWAYIIPNATGIIANLCDCVYTPFTGRRTTWNVFSEFGNESNLGTVIGTEIINHWWLVLTGLLLIWLTYRLYSPVKKETRKGLATYYIWHTAMLAVVAPLLVFGMRGGIGKAVRPITLSNANQYVSSPNEAAIVLNTPFTLIRTIGKKPFTEKNYFSEDELDAIYTPLQQFAAQDSTNKKNIVIFIVESFGKEYIGAYNPRTDGSLTPFLDSLITKSRSYLHSYGNGKKSIDGMPSILSSIPMFVEPFFVADASLNRVSSIAGELKNIGYNSSFFHGAPNGSMGFQAFAKTCGFQEYYGMNEYCSSPKHNGMDDHDGTWAIWDEPFLQYFAESIDEMKEPFVTSVFTASSHHPFKIPEEYNNEFKGGDDPFLKCVQYTDYSLKRFFEHASKQEWYNNTLFVITADHTNHSSAPRYKTAAGWFEVPIIFFHPNGEAPFAPGLDSTMTAQQIDIMPTILEYIGYSRPFVAFGKSLISTPAQESYAVNYTNEIYQYYKGGYVLHFNGEKSIALYDLKHDELMRENILGKSSVQENMERKLKAIIQQYMSRMVHDRLTADNGKE